MGWFDEVKGIWKIESKYYPERINPYFQRLEKKLDIIHFEITGKIKKRKA